MLRECLAAQPAIDARAAGQTQKALADVQRARDGGGRGIESCFGDLVARLFHREQGGVGVRFADAADQMRGAVKLSGAGL